MIVSGRWAPGFRLPSEPELRLNIYTANPDTPTADGLKLLASWAATQELAEASQTATDQT